MVVFLICSSQIIKVLKIRIVLSLIITKVVLNKKIIDIDLSHHQLLPRRTKEFYQKKRLYSILLRREKFHFFVKTHNFYCTQYTSKVAANTTVFHSFILFGKYQISFYYYEPRLSTSNVRPHDSDIETKENI